MIRVTVRGPKRNQGVYNFHTAEEFFQYLETHFYLPDRTLAYYKRAFSEGGSLEVATLYCRLSACDEGEAMVTGGLKPPTQQELTEAIIEAVRHWCEAQEFRTVEALFISFCKENFCDPCGTFLSVATKEKIVE